MNEPSQTRAQQVALAVLAFQREQMGRAPESALVVLGDSTLVVTLRGALSPAEQTLARAPPGEALVRELHRALFASTCGPLKQEVGRIIGAAVLDATAEVQGSTGTVVQVFLLTTSVPADTWAGPAPGA